MAEDVLGADKDGNVKLFIVKGFALPIVICQIVKVFMIICPSSSASGGTHARLSLR